MSGQNIIFLDFDGIIVHSDSGPKEMDRACVLRINQAAELTKSKIAIHSTWIYVREAGLVQNLLQAAGLKVEYLHKDFVCISEMGEKPDAISTWLLAHPEVKNYVVLDDELIDGHPQVQILQGWLNGGIQEKHIEEIVKVIGI